MRYNIVTVNETTIARKCGKVKMCKNMCIIDKYGYKFYIDQYGKVIYILVRKHKDVEKLRPYKWDRKINDWVNVSGYIEMVK